MWHNTLSWLLHVLLPVKTHFVVGDIGCFALEIMFHSLLPVPVEIVSPPPRVQKVIA